ncbi:UbiE/COQ5 family methyltransferase [Canariomyces notabilis]|uniref:UbiE/COQ5 family methyltransferase n=1 Tax=Canariomyces notabilis TaxID=2074819 RepID=A0AAN6TGX9_9PEZI|nr:UbiE/COQ5 family methyltransferase [Canariomyces arenarius]
MTNTDSDVRFWDSGAEKYSKSAISDLGGYERTLDRTRELLRPDSRVVELGGGTGATALRLAGCVRSYLGTDIAPAMIEIANRRLATGDTPPPPPGLAFRVATADQLAAEPDNRFDAVLAFNYLHLVRDLPGTLGCANRMLGPGGLFISKTPCLRDMNPLVWFAGLPLMRAVGLAPYCSVFSAAELKDKIAAAGFEIVATEYHATKGSDARPFIVARKVAVKEGQV